MFKVLNSIKRSQELVHSSLMALNQTRHGVIDQLRQVYGDQHHPLLEETAAAYDNNVNIQIRELVLLLISKITHEYQRDPKAESPLIDHQEIVHKQLILTEIIELIYKTNLLHKSIANHRVGTSRLRPEDWNIHYNNKLAILFGDYYVARAWASLGRLRSIDVNLLMSQGISDFTEGQFIMQTDVQLPVTPIQSLTLKAKDNPIKDWERRHYLMHASLPGHACQSISTVAGLNLFLQEAAFKFGKNFSFCWQILTEMEPFLSNLHSSYSKSSELVIDLKSLPVLLHVQESINKPVEKLFLDSSSNNRGTLNVIELYKSITGGLIIEQIREIKNRYADEALNAIECFTKCNASSALIDILNVIKES
ncbi:decaprenyl-diphosphate synthase subunit 2 [Tetranychus urticae]|uniref:Uncharacterized protein n=1 Tax=Tetranychus urticae TaxID=32264 RepID=T1L2C6_TETUR|nr:decaprenyl-diphosphate synthase subunit 2 [Tetranychus urticae]